MLGIMTMKACADGVIRLWGKPTGNRSIRVARKRGTRDVGLMATITVQTQFGNLSIVEDDGAITQVNWGGAADGAATPLLQEAVAQMRAYDQGQLQVFDLPLRVDGTDFQRAVCDAMSAIAFGEDRKSVV